MAKALEIWPLHVIKEALWDEADGIHPQAIRGAELRVRLQRHHIEMLHYRADQQETTVSDVMERELDGIVSAHIGELSAALQWSPSRWRGGVMVAELLGFAVSAFRGRAVLRVSQ